MADTIENTFTEEERAALEAEHRRIAIISSEGGDYEIVIGPADRLQWRTFRSKSTKEDERDSAQEVLVTSTIVAIAYKGAKTIGKVEARKVLGELLKDWAGCTDGAEVFGLLKRVNMGQGERRSGK